MATQNDDTAQGFAAAVAAAEQGVVHVDAGGRHPATGSAWSEDTLITSQAAIGDADELRVTLADGAQHAAKLVGRDPGLDVALLRVSGARLSPLAFVRNAALQVGQWVVALGRPGQVIRASARIVGVLGPE